jgi:pilus assembly protein TadC
VVAVVGAVAVPALALGLGRLERGQDRLRLARLREQAPGGLDAIAACLDAGLPLRRGTEVVAGLSPVDLAVRLRIVVSGIGVGLSDADAWLALAADPVLGTVARDVSRAADWGTAVSSVLTDAAQDLRRQAEVESKTRARAVGVRTVLPLTVCYLPAFILLGIVPILGAGIVSVLG